MQANFGDQVDFVGVAGRDDIDAIQAFISDLGVSDFPHVFDDAGDIWAEYGVTSQPAWAFIDADGNAEVVFGALGESELTERVTALSS